MDYEYRIQLLEKETAHLREMQRLAIDRQDTADMRLDKLGEIAHLLASKIDTLASTVDTLASKVDTLAVKMDSFIDMMLRQPHNGH
jgi:hypothetical protein